MTCRDKDVDMAPLADALEMMLPFAMAELRHCTAGQLEARASRAAVLVGTHGDSLQFYGSPSSRSTERKLSGSALAVGGLAEGIAAAELLNPGGGRELLDKLSPRQPRRETPAEPADDGPWWAPLIELERLMGIEPPAAPEPTAPEAVTSPVSPPRAPRPVHTIELPLFDLETEAVS